MVALAEMNQPATDSRFVPRNTSSEISVPRAADGGPRHEKFPLAMARALGRKVDAHDPAVIREAAARSVAQLFYVPLLAEMRRLPFGQTIGHGGRGEEVFGEQLDLRIADAVAAQDRGLTEQVAKALRARCAEMV